MENAQAKSSESKALTRGDLRNKQIFDQVVLNVCRERQQKLGCRVSEQGIGVICVTAVDSNAPTFGLVQPGDYIIRINGHKIKNREKLFHCINEATMVIKLVVARHKNSSESTSTLNYNEIKSDSAMVRTAKFGYKIKDSKEYLLVKVTKGKNKRLGLRIKRTKKGKIVISRIESDSYVLDLLRVGDRLLAINDQKVIEKGMCHKLITECKGEFEALIERSLKDDQVSSVFTDTKSSYSEPDPSNYEHQLGDPQNDYETAPKDVRDILNERLNSIVQSFGAAPKKSTFVNKNQSSKVTIYQKVVKKDIASEIDPNRPLRKPTK